MVFVSFRFGLAAVFECGRLTYLKSHFPPKSVAMPSVFFLKSVAGAAEGV